MKVEVFDNSQQVAVRAHQLMKEVVDSNSRAVLGLATGSTPLMLYKLMREDGSRYAGVTTVNLDEYVGLDGDNVNSYRYYMNTNLFDHIGVDPINTHLPLGNAEDLEQECDRYDQLLSRYVQDIQILGIGSNGHIAFNEPNTPFDSKTHVVELTESTRQDNARLFGVGEQVPTHALTMGIDSIMASKYIVVLATGEAKADAVKAMVEGEVTPLCPASILQRHPNCILLCDKSSAQLLKG